MSSTFAFPIMFLLSQPFHELNCGADISSLINSVCQESSASESQSQGLNLAILDI